jgi:hypothetical protein
MCLVLRFSKFSDTPSFDLYDLWLVLSVENGLFAVYRS